MAFYALLLAYVVLLLFEARGYSSDPRLFPILVGVPLTILLLGKLILIFSEPLDVDIAGPFAGVLEGREIYGSDAERDTPDRYRREAEILLWIAVLFASIWLLGFLLAAFVYVTGFIYHQERKPKRASLAGVATTVFLYVLFVRILSAPTYEGVLVGLL